MLFGSSTSKVLRYEEVKEFAAEISSTPSTRCGAERYLAHRAPLSTSIRTRRSRSPPEFGRFLYDEALTAFSYTQKALNAVNSTWIPE